MSTYAEEKKAKDKEKAKRARKYRFEPVPFDKFCHSAYHLEEGMIVVKTQPHGCPKNGTMGQCYVANLDGEFLGMVCLKSLVPVSKK